VVLVGERPSDGETHGAGFRGERPPRRGRGIRFVDRHDAGRRLAALLEPLRHEQPVVAGLPRGGVPVAAEVARALGAPLDVVVVRKIGAPQNSEYAIGAVAEGGVHVLGRRVGRAADLSGSELDALIARAEHQLEERVRRYRGSREPIALDGRTVIVVDDGLATGRSALAAVDSLRKRGAARVILAAPVASREAASMLAAAADELVCVEIPPDLWAVGAWYADFRPTTDEEVAALLAENRPERLSDRPPS
jgi:putative phosphoribosyl transferase